MTAPTPERSPRRDLWIPALFVLFFVGLAGLQAWFVVLAQSTFTGVVTDQPLRQEDATAADLITNIAFEPAGSLAGVVRLDFRDRDGQPVSVEEIQATAERGTRFPQSLPVDFQSTGDGAYAARLDLPLAGPWTIRVVAIWDDRSFETIATVEIEP